jgi:hypothetical protein
MVNWLDTLEDAAAMAANTDRLVLLDFFSPT